jgi:uncharacterized protein YjiS (DUF1127 family)
MATTEFTHAGTSRPALGFLPAMEAAARRIAALWKAVQNRRAVAALAQWDDRMLRDIGITHGDVMSALSSQAQDDPSERLSAISRERRSALRAQALEQRRMDRR